MDYKEENPIMNERNLKSLYSVCGACFYIFVRYNTDDISNTDWERIRSYTGIPKVSVYSIEVEKGGFVLRTRK